MARINESGVSSGGGERGPEGPEGKEGKEGAKGVEGAKGATGATGPEGPKGATGTEGKEGPAGAKGEQGVKGEKGERGEKGEAGAGLTVGKWKEKVAREINKSFTPNASAPMNVLIELVPTSLGTATVGLIIGGVTLFSGVKGTGSLGMKILGPFIVGANETMEVTATVSAEIEHFYTNYQEL